VNDQDRSGKEQRAIHDHKATCAAVIIGAVAVCSPLPYGICCVLHNTMPSQLEDAVIIGVFIACYCILAEAFLWPLAVLELWNFTGTWRLVVNLGIGAYITALMAFFFCGFAHSPVW
jgi:hypothetical protein